MAAVAGDELAAVLDVAATRVYALAKGLSVEDAEKEIEQAETEGATLFGSMFAGAKLLVAAIVPGAVPAGKSIKDAVAPPKATPRAPEAPNNAADSVDPSTPVGRRDGFDDTSPDGPQPDGSGQSNPQLQVPSPTNSPAVINGRSYSGHALDRMQGRGLTPTVIDNTIRPGNAVETVDGVTTYVDPVNNVTAIVNDVTGNVITVY